MNRKPETIKIAIARADGGLSVMSFVTKEHGGVMMENGKLSPGWEREPTQENINAEITKAGIAATGWNIVAEDDIPQDRYFRNAWKGNGNRIDVDMPKAREIQRDVIRAKRVSMLADLDTQYMRADEAGNTAEKARIAAEKQKLRDFTKDPRIDAAKTPEELKSILP